MDEGVLVLALDPDSAFILSPSWRTSKGTPRTPNVYSSVVFPPLLLSLSLLSSLEPLKLLRSWYSSMVLSTLLLDEERTVSDNFKKNLKSEDRNEKIPESRQKGTKDERTLLDKALRWGSSRREISEM